MRLALAALLFFLTACSRLDPLTLEAVQSAEQKWQAAKPGLYRLVVEMQGDRIEPNRFDISVRGEEVSIRRDGQVVIPSRPRDYSMEGWFRMLRQELDLADNPALLGAPAGYSSYPMASFDPATGRLIRFQRTVGGTQNSIEINIVEFEVEGQDSRP
jgi:hypothetical protein